MFPTEVAYKRVIFNAYQYYSYYKQSRVHWQANFDKVVKQNQEHKEKILQLEAKLEEKNNRIKELENRKLISTTKEKVKENVKKKFDTYILQKNKNSLVFNVATYQIATFKDNGDYADIAHICNNCKKDLESGILPYCELCGRLKRNRKACFCNLLKENKTRELEKEQSVAKEELKIERKKVVKF
ncbi:7912_t:CDS:2 [Funneliformis geosporum]|uniref:7912_t:CDS:1 n=1 Tax=Funneliformis geosporum TaxID=1117311 RepID=A0A9W4STJ6_9GLOM|nr:7912_t:CDS:2 [Funneliformis geosporum]